MDKFAFSMPPSRPGEPAPVWSGREFVVGNDLRRILRYETGASGWNDELTALHEEETAGGSHFIDVASRARAVAALQRYLSPQESPVILEVGVSGGHLLADLAANFPQASIVGADYTIGSLEAIAPRCEGVPLIQIDLTKSPFPSGGIDGIVILNVLEHIEDDRLAISHCFRMLKPGGVLVVEVPAGPDLYDDYDKELMHFRRYRRHDLVKKLSEAGFHIEEASHIGFLFYPPFWLSKKRSRMRGEKNANHSRVRAAIQTTSRFNAIAKTVMQIEQWLARNLQFPVGIRCTAICRKPD